MVVSRPPEPRAALLLTEDADPDPQPVLRAGLARTALGAAAGLALLPLQVADAVVRRGLEAAGDLATAVRDRVSDEVADAVETGTGLVEDAVDMVGGAVEEGVDLVGDTFGQHRRVWEDQACDHVQIEVHGIDEPRARRLRRRLKEALEQLDGVEWAEVNAITRRVAVGIDGTDPLAAVLSAVEGVEDAEGLRAGLTRRRTGEAAWDTDDRAEHPADVEPVHRATVALVGGGLSLGWSIVGRLARVPRMPAEVVGLVSVVDNVPWLRSRLERVIGRRAADLVLPLGSALAGGLSQGPVGTLVDLGHQGLLLGELRARRRVWSLREPEFYTDPSDEPIEPPVLGPRPIPLPSGPVERWSERISLASLAGFGLTLAGTGDPRRAADAFLAGMPKAARLGREGFAIQLGRTLAARGVVPLDGSALRRLDRVDTVVVDSDALWAGGYEIGPVVVLGDGDEGVLRGRGEALLDPDDPTAVRRDAGWSLHPREGLDGVTLPRGALARMAEVARGGARPLVLSRDGVAVAVVGAAARLDPGAQLLVAAVRDAGHRLVVAGRKGRTDRLVGADATIPRGRRLGRAIRDLQASGAVVAAIGRRGKHGLAAADVGIGLTRRTGRPPWGADLVLGRELADAAFIIQATVVAAEVSRRSAHFALAGSAIGALVSMTGPRTTAGTRCLAMVNGAAGASLLAGTWSAVELAHRPRAHVPDRTPWHALPAEEVLAALDVDAGGLASAAAQQRRRSARPDEPEVGLAEPFLAELANPLNPVLAVGAGLSAAVGSMVDAGLVLGLVGVNTLIGGVQRLQADRAVAELMTRTACRTAVLRDGREQQVAEDAVVRGDVAILRAGDAVPADMRLLSAEGLEVDESTLTGESVPVAKSTEPSPAADVADRTCLLHGGTTVAAGSARAVVVATGADTQMARSLEAGGRPPATGVEQRLRALTRRLVPGAALAAGGVAGLGMLRGWPLRDIAGTGVSLALASVPEGLPFVSSAAQLAAATRLSTRNAVARNPRTIEALGRVEVLCCDKTGTLTEGRMRLLGVSDGRRTRRTTELDAAGRDALAAALRASAVADGNGNQTDQAIVEAAAAAAVAADTGLAGWERVSELPFEATRGVAAVLGRCAGGNRLSVKGAPEAVLPQCTSWAGGDLDRAALAAVEEHVEDLARSGCRVIAVAERVASDRADIDTDRLARLELRGLLAFADPPRAAAGQAIARISQGGIRTVMVTGDHPETAVAIAAELGMATGVVLTGTQVDELDDEELDAVVTQVGVFARVAPAQKVRIVQAYQRRGTAVAMTGDGTNDAAAIRLADVGVALGSRATPAARDAADLVVTDDRIETLIDAVVEGRALWGSVREALAILVGGNLGEIGFTAFASLLSRRAPLSPRQLMLVNLFTDLAPAVAIAIRPPADRSPEALLREGPERSLGAALTRDMTVRAVATAAGASLAWGGARLTGLPSRAATVGLVALVGTQLGQTVLAGGWREPLVLATGLGSAAALAAVVQTPGLSHFFGCRPLGPLDWGQALGSAALAAAGGQVTARVLQSRADRPAPALG
jgi:cation-transporting P-type ATPase I